MIPRTEARTLPDVPPEVRAFAAEQGVAEYLPAVVEMTQRIFAGARRVVVFTEGDPEIANDWHIVFEVEVPWDVPRSLAAERQWVRGLFESCPVPLGHVFRLGVDLVE